MGWKASFIVIQNQQIKDYESTLKDLGFGALKKAENLTFEEAIYPDEDKVYIGTYNNNLIICAENVPMYFFEDELTEQEIQFDHIFPKTEISAFQLHSGVNLWGFAILKNGKKLRAKAGSSEDGTIVDYGTPINEEKELLSKSILQSDGSRTYKLENDPDEEYSEDQVGENFVFAVSKRYFNEELDKNDNLLFETELEGYSYSIMRKNRTLKKERESKYDWVVVVIIAVLIYRIFFK